MKGIVFNVFEDFLTEVGGEDLYDDLLDSVTLQTQEPFVGPGTYPDADLMALFTAAVERLRIDPADALRAFGRFLFGRLLATAPQYAEGHDLRSFLLTIHDVIHVEVRKLYPDAVTPDFTYEEPAADRLIMHYRSPRRLWHLAEGLIQAGAEHFDDQVAIDVQPSADDPDRCTFDLRFGGQ